MNKQETAEAIVVMQAWIDGDTVEEKDRDPDGVQGWHPYDHNPLFNFERYEYRIKPSPREFWIKIPDAWKAGDQLHVLKGSDPMISGSRSKWTHVREILNED